MATKLGKGTLCTVSVLGLGVLLASACDVNIRPPEVVQGSGNSKTETRDVHDFDSVGVRGSGTLIITQGSSEHLTVTAEDNVLPKLRSDVSGGHLDLGPDPSTSINTSQPIRYELTVKQLKRLELAGSVDGEAQSVEADQLDLRVAGSGGAKIGHLTAKSLTVSIAGSGSVTVAGQAPEERATIAGSGAYHASDLQSKQATISISGSGDCAVRVSDSLHVTVAGSGSVVYYGSPSVSQQIIGTGSVTQAG